MNYLCNHDPFDKTSTLRAIIKRPLKLLSEDEKQKEMTGPDSYCEICEEEILSFPPNAICVRK